MLGHRHSVDLDWFTDEPIDDPHNIVASLKDAGNDLIISVMEKGTLHATCSGNRISSLAYRYSLLQPLVTYKEAGLGIKTWRFNTSTW